MQGEQGILERPNLLRIAPVSGERELPSIYACDPAKLTVTAGKGTIEFTYEQPDLMRIRVKGVSMRVFYEPQMHEGGVERAKGEVELGFHLIGKLLFKELSGTMTNNARWNFREVCPYPFHITLNPDPVTGIGELAVHEYASNLQKETRYADFDAAYQNLLRDFEEFLENYPPVPVMYRDMARKAAWTVWHSYLGPRGSLKKPIIYMHKLFMNRAFGWHQCFHAMAMTKNTREAWALLLSMFAYQDSAGGGPDNISDINQFVRISTKPPLYGYAVVYILDHFDTSVLMKEDYQDLYDKLSLYADWWLTHHDHVKSGYPAYYHVDESGYDESTLFNEGLPIQAPDLQAYMVLLCEALSRLAALTGETGEAERWMNTSKRILKFLTDELWDGEQFLAKLTTSGTYYKCGSIAQLQPVMLGNRLPEPIRKKLVQRLLDPGEFFTDFGVATENLKSGKLMMRAFTRGAVVAPTQFLLIYGLLDAGEKKAAETLAAKYLNALMIKGLALGIHPYRVEPVSGDQIPEEATAMSVGFPFSAWVGSIFLALAGRMAENEAI